MVPAVEPVSEPQGSIENALRKVCYSSNGPMVDIYAPAEGTMAAAFASGEDYARDDNSNFYDTFFGGTSSACPHVAGVVSLFVEKNRSADQDDVRSFLKTDGCKTGLISDPITGVNDSGYFNVSIYGTSQPAGNLHSHNTAGSGNLRGSPNRILFNPLSSPINVNNTILKISGGSLNIDGTVNLNSMNT